MNISANNITNQSQLQANDYILFNANGWVLNDEFAKLISNQSITINASSDITNKGLIAANTDLTLTATGNIYNLAPTIPNGSTQTQIDNLKATYGAIYGGSGTTTITSNNGKIINQNKISSSNNLIINANKITDGSNNFGIENTGQIAAANSLTINSKSFLTNKSGGSILSAGNIFLYVDDFLENNQSEIWAQNNVVIQKNASADKNNKVTNLSGKISAYSGNVNIKTEHLINQNIQENLIIRTTPNESVNINGFVQNVVPDPNQWNHWYLYLDNDASLNGQVLNNPVYDDGYMVEFVAARNWHLTRNVYVRYQKNADANGNNDQRGYIKAGNDVNISATTVDNIVSNIEVKNNVNINATTVNNKSYYLSELVGYGHTIDRHDSIGYYHLGRPHSTTRMATNIDGVPIVFIRNYDVIESVIIGKNSTNINSTSANNTGYTSNFGILNGKIVEYAIGQERYYDAGGYLTNYEESAIGLKTIAADSAKTSIGNIEKTSSLNIADSPIALPDSGNGMFKNSPDTKYLIETNLAFLDKSQFLGSNYFLTRLGFDPNVDIIQQRLGDNVYEQQMISQAISNLTKGDYLFSNVNSDYEQMQRLYDNAYDEYQAFNSNPNIADLEIGKALTDAQKQALTKDIIWLVEKDLNGKKVLVTEVYLASTTIDKIKNNQLALAGNASGNVGSVIKGKNLNITTTKDLKNQGSIFASNNLSLASNNIFNQTINSSIKSLNGSTLIQTNNDFINYQGTVSSGGNLSIISAGDIKNLGGTMSANNQLNLFATGNIINASLISTNDKNLLNSGNEAYASGYQGEYFTNDGLNGIHNGIYSSVISTASLKSGETNIGAGGNFTNQAANIFSAKNAIDPAIVGGTATTSTGDVNINSAGNVEISALEVHNYSKIVLGDKKNRSTTTTDITTNALSNVNSAGNFTIESGNNTILNAANITTNEKLTINSTNNLIITTATNSNFLHEEIKKENTFTFKNIDRGSFDTTVINTNITAGVANGLNNAAIEINTGNKNYVEYNKNSIANPSASLSSYLTKLNDNQTLYNPITETHKHWDDVTRGLTSTSQILIAVAMSALIIATGGAAAAGAAAAGAAGATSGGVVAVGAAATSVAVTSTAATIATTSATTAAMNADGNLLGSLDDIGKTTLKDTTSKDSLKSIAIAGLTAAVTAGLVAGADHLASGSSTTSSIAGNTTLSNPMAAYAPATSGFANISSQTVNILKDVTINTAASSAVNSAVNGDSLTDSLQNAGKNILINAAGQVLANQIGTAAHNGDINTTTQLTLHAGLGCAMGAAASGSGGCGAGAAAGVMGELAGMGMRDSVQSGSIQRETAVQLAGLAGSAAALATSVATGQDDQTTADNISSGQNIGGNAARNNALALAVPIVIKGTEALLLAGTALAALYGGSKTADIISGNNLEGFGIHLNEGSVFSTPISGDNSSNIFSTPIHQDGNGNILSTPISDYQRYQDQGFGVETNLSDTGILYNDSLVADKGKTHILDGDSTGGGHRYGTGIPGKSEFPQGWSDNKILDTISDVATDPSATRTPSYGGRTVINSTREGVNIRVVVDKNGNIVTGFPTNVPRNK